MSLLVCYAVFIALKTSKLYWEIGMVPPQEFFGILPAWAGVYAALIITVILSSLLLHKRVFWLISQGKSAARFDQPWKRLSGAMSIVFGQRKVLQRVGSIDPRSRKIDLAGLGHA